MTTTHKKMEILMQNLQDYKQVITYLNHSKYLEIELY